jgi:hypothetical protein
MLDTDRSQDRQEEKETAVTKYISIKKVKTMLK